MAKSGLPSVASIVQKQIQNTSAATQAYTQGVQRVTSAPGQAAANVQQKYLNGVQANVGKWASNVGSVSLQSWQQAAVSKGAPRLASGIQAAQSKLTAFWTQFLPFLSQAQQQVNSMPSDTFDQRIAKMDAMARTLHGFTFKP